MKKNIYNSIVLFLLLTLLWINNAEAYIIEVDTIFVEGYNSTKPETILDYCTFRVNQQLGSRELEHRMLETKYRLDASHFFSYANIYRPQLNAYNKEAANVQIDLKEAIKFGLRPDPRLGYKSYNTFFDNTNDIPYYAELSYRNLLGYGGSFALSFNDKIGSLTYTDDYILGKPIGIMLNGFGGKITQPLRFITEHNEVLLDTTYNLEITGAEAGFRWHITRKFNFYLSAVNYQAKLNDTVSPYNDTEEQIFAIHPSIIYDRRDIPQKPTWGAYFAYDGEISLGSDDDYSRHLIDTRLYYTMHLWDKSQTIAIQGAFGWASDRTPIYRQFNLNGINGLRGYEPMLGNWMGLLNMEVRFPITHYIVDWEGVVFDNLGKTFHWKEYPHLSTMSNAYGIGLRANVGYPFHFTLRAELGHSKNDNMFYIGAKQ